MSRVKSSAYGVLAGLIFILIVTIIGAVTYLHYDYDPYLIVLIMQLAYCSGSFLAGFITSRLYGRNGIISGLIASLVIAFVCVALNILFGGRYITMTLIITVIIVIGAGMSGGVLSLNVGKNKTV
mgnify:CR=1 FL=1